MMVYEFDYNSLFFTFSYVFFMAVAELFTFFATYYFST